MLRIIIEGEYIEVTGPTGRGERSTMNTISIFWAIAATLVLEQNEMKPLTIIECEAGSDAGEIDPREIEWLAGYLQRECAGKELSKDYWATIRASNGGIPKNQWFKTKKGDWERFGRFHNFCSEKSIEGFIQGVGEGGGEDRRLCQQVSSALSGEPVCRRLTVYHVPFGLLYHGRAHPDEVSSSDPDLLCFDLHGDGEPRIVVLRSDDAIDVAFRYDERGELIPYSEAQSYCEPVANSFAEFASLLQEEMPEELKKPRVKRSVANPAPTVLDGCWMITRKGRSGEISEYKHGFEIWEIGNGKVAQHLGGYISGVGDSYQCLARIEESAKEGQCWQGVLRTDEESLEKDEEGWHVVSHDITRYRFRLKGDTLELLESTSYQMADKEIAPKEWKPENYLLTVFRRCEPPEKKTDSESQP